MRAARQAGSRPARVPTINADTIQNSITVISGRTSTGKVESVQLTPEGSTALNYAFDVTPRRFVTGLVTEFGVFPPLPEEMTKLREEAEETDVIGER